MVSPFLVSRFIITSLTLADPTQLIVRVGFPRIRRVAIGQNLPFVDRIMYVL